MYLCLLSLREASAGGLARRSVTHEAHHSNEGGVAREEVGNLLNALAILREYHHSGLNTGCPIHRLRTTTLLEVAQHHLFQFPKLWVAIEDIGVSTLRGRGVVAAPGATSNSSPRTLRG